MTPRRLLLALLRRLDASPLPRNDPAWLALERELLAKFENAGPSGAVVRQQRVERSTIRRIRSG